jgi:hypothetical protein
MLNVFYFYFYYEGADSHRQINVLRAKVSMSICSILRERISLLKQFGLTGLSLNADSKCAFNAGTVLGYSVDDWMSIKMYSGLWNPHGKFQTEEIWTNKLSNGTSSKNGTIENKMVLFWRRLFRKSNSMP